MDRRLLVLVAFAALIPLAGCSIDASANVVPSVNSVEPSQSGEYELTVSVNVDATENAPVDDVSVVGYNLAAERICATEVGDVTGQATATVSCSSVPSLVVTQTPDRGTAHESTDSDSSDDGLPFIKQPDSGPQTVVTGATLYLGYQNDSHRFREYTNNLDREWGFGYQNGSLKMSKHGRRDLLCPQREAATAGANFSAIEKSQWLNASTKRVRTRVTQSLTPEMAEKSPRTREVGTDASTAWRRKPC